MARNVQFQALRGTQAQLATLQSGIDPSTGAVASPLAFGEMYFATDSGNLFFGTPGTGVGFIQIGDTAAVNDTLQQIAVLLECIRRAMVSLACDSGRGAQSSDFDPEVVAGELADSDIPT